MNPADIGTKRLLCSTASVIDGSAWTLLQMSGRLGDPGKFSSRDAMFVEVSGRDGMNSADGDGNLSFPLRCLVC